MIKKYYRKDNKHIIVEAIQFVGSNIMDCHNFVGGYKIYQILNFKEGTVTNAIKVRGKEKKIFNNYYITKTTKLGFINVYTPNYFEKNFEEMKEN